MLASPSGDRTIRLWDAETGESLRTLTGHRGYIFAVAFDPAGYILASSSNDESVMLWRAASGELIRLLEGHAGWVSGVAFDPTGQMLAGAGEGNNVKVWNLATEKLRRSKQNHTSRVSSAAFDPTGRTLASASDDGSVKHWDADSGQLIRSLDAHTSSVLNVAFDPTGSTLATASADHSVKHWDATSGQLLRSLEGHTGTVTCVAFSSDGRLIASKGGSGDNTIRLWRSDTGSCVATIPEPAGGRWLSGLAFHPLRRLLATVGSDPGTPMAAADRLIHIWELDFDVLLAQTGTPPVSYTSAKIVLVGDSGVGKTGLGWRLAHGEFKEHASTHGQQFWVLDRLNASRRDGARCEAVLWDLAGQPDYRLIHALFLDDADLALVLFDPTDSRDPLHGVEFWLKQLKHRTAVAPVQNRETRGMPAAQYWSPPERTVAPRR